jgi:beta propeller repeat protein
MYDFGTKKETRISTSGKASMPAIHRNRIVWADTRSEKSDIYLYDLSTKKQSRITTSGNAYNPKVYDNVIVWQDSTSAYEPGNIWMYDLSSKKKTQITKNGSAEMPDIYKNRIVWQDSRNTNEGEWYSDIYMYDLSNKKETKISTSRRASDPAINGNMVVWLDGSINDIDPNYACPAEVGVYDLSTGKETSIPLSVCEVAIYGDKIVGTRWNDAEGTSHISMYDLSSNAETLITDGPHTVSPAIYGNRIVWADTRDEEIGTAEDIYMGTLVYPPVTAFFASPTSGKAPLKVQFTDKSTGTPTKWKWSFGDGTYSTQKNPAHTYSKAGKYTVALTASNAAGSNTLKKPGYINVAAPLKAPTAAFSASPRSGKAPLKVQFTDRSTNSPTSWYWNFGDKSTSTTKNPVHKYNKAGKYTVSLTVKNAAGSNIKKISNYITVK